MLPSPRRQTSPGSAPAARARSTTAHDPPRSQPSVSVQVRVCSSYSGATASGPSSRQSTIFIFVRLARGRGQQRRGRLVLSTNLVVHLSTMYRDVRGGSDAQSHLVFPDPDDLHLDSVADDDG